MKKLGWILPLSFILCACPFESDVPLEKKPVEPVDSSLLGYWYGIIKDGSDFFGIEALEITAKSDSVYAITRYGKAIKGDMIMPDTSYYTGYISWVGPQRFMNVEGYVNIEQITAKKKREIKKQRVFYATALDRRNDTLEVRAVTEDFSARKYFGDSDHFRLLIAEMLKLQQNIYDAQYSMQYRKIPKPAKLF
ncbi:MAG TPA: hypothetical protein VFV31_05120 [Chitinophagaceae bacterium]|nr:hypothetical protein [Chitinophagaceae bacterium]